VELHVEDLERLGATPADLSVWWFKPSDTSVRLWWFFAGPRLAVESPRLLAAASRAGLVPRLARVTVLADMSSAYLEGADMTGRVAERVRFDGANLDGASLRSARLRGASFKGVEARGASFQHAEASCASFRDANLVGADLRFDEVPAGEDFEGANLLGARWPEDAKPPPGWALVAELLVPEAAANVVKIADGGAAAAFGAGLFGAVVGHMLGKRSPVRPNAPPPSGEPNEESGPESGEVDR
jgi:hypothetical protein